MKLRIASIGLAAAMSLVAGQALATVTVQGWWHFDSTGNPQDSSGNGHNYVSGFVYPGTAPGPVVSSEAAGGPLGTNGYTSTHSLRLGLNGDADTFWNTGYVPPPTNYGVEIWIKPQNKGGIWNDLGNEVWIFSSGGFQCCSGPSGGECVRVVKNSFPDGSAGIQAGIIYGQNSTLVQGFGPLLPVDTNSWMHLAILNFDGTIVFYTNGVPCATNDVTTPTAPAGVMHLGTDGAYNAFDGFVDEERVFTFADGAFSPSDLLYTATPRVITEPPSIAVWSNSAATLSIAVSADPCAQYQWNLYGTNAVAGAIGPDLYLNPLATSNQWYNCLLTNGCIAGGSSVTSSTATVTLAPVQTANVNAYRSAVTAEPSLVAYYPVDADSGSTLTDTKAGNNGTFQGNAHYDGQTNRAFGVKAVLIPHGDGDVQIPQNASLEFAGGNGTVEAVVYLTSPVTPAPGSYATIFSVASADGTAIHYELAAAIDGGSLFCTNDSGVSLSWPVPVNLLNRFAHVAFVFSGGTSVTAYVDGQSLGTKTQSGFGTGTQPAWIGAPLPWYGTVDELAVYGSALSADTLAIHNSKFLFGTNTAAPTIVSQPTSKTLLAGGSPQLQVTVAGTPPLTYQWTSNGIPIAGATGPLLTLPHTTPSFSATYSMYVTNLYGWTNTQPILLTFVAPQANGYAAAVMSDGPIAFWRLAESSGPTAVDSAGLQDGIYNSTGVTYSASGPPGDPNSGVTFDGTAGRVVVPYNEALNPAGPFSIEFWARPNSLAAQGPVSSMTPGRSGGYEFYLRINYGGYEFHTGLGGGYNMITGEGAAPPLGVWSHVVGVCDGGTNIYLYVNGYLVGTGNGTAFSANPSNPFFIGCRRSSTAFFNGSISDVAFYNYQLSSNQILTHATAGLPLKLAVSPSSQVIVDSKPSGTPFDGLNQGTTWVASDTGRTGVMQFNPSLTTDNEIMLFGYPGLANTNGTIMFWMRSAGVIPSGYNNGDDGCIMLWRMPGVQGGGMFIGLTQNGAIQLQGGYNQPGCTGNTIVTNNAWHHITMTFDLSSVGPTNLWLYVDGVLDNSALSAYDWMWPNQSFTIQLGADMIGYDSYWNDYSGELDDLRFYNTILSPSDIATAMGGGLISTNLVLRYNFDTPPTGYVVTWPYGGLLTAGDMKAAFAGPGGLTNNPAPFPAYSPFPISVPTMDRLGKQFFRGYR